MENRIRTGFLVSKFVDLQFQRHNFLTYRQQGERMYDYLIGCKIDFLDRKAGRSIRRQFSSQVPSVVEFFFHEVEHVFDLLRLRRCIIAPGNVEAYTNAEE